MILHKPTGRTFADRKEAKKALGANRFLNALRFNELEFNVIAFNESICKNTKEVS